VAEHNLLNAKRVWSLPDGLHRDRKYLSLEVRNGGTSRAWVFRYTKPDGTKARINIGPLAKVSVADARQIADKYCGWLAHRKDPAAERELEAAEIDKASVTVNEVLDNFERTKLGKKRANTQKSAKQYFKLIRGAVGHLPAVDITRHVLIEKLELKKLWVEKHVTCQQLCGYLRRIFEIVQSDFHLTQNAGANLTIGFEASYDVHTVQHHPEMSYTEVPIFLDAVRKYRNRGGAGKGEHPTVALWCECVFLTGVRAGEVRLAEWKEIDWKTKTWNVPPEHRKTGDLSNQIRPIPITPSVERVLREMQKRYPDARRDDPIFPATRERNCAPGGLAPFPEDTIMKFIRWSLRWPRRVTAHSARNAFMGWAQTTCQDQRLIERQLDHALPEDGAARKQSAKVRRAYQRDMLLEPRRKMMAAYDAHCNHTESSSDNVNTFPDRRSA
jgi:integrase